MLVEMAKDHSLNIEDYLVLLLNARPRKAVSDAKLEQLMPWSGVHELYLCSKQNNVQQSSTTETQSL